MASHDVIWTGKTYMLDEGTLVLESVTLAQVIELMVQVLIYLARRTILDEQAAKDTQAPHPHDLTVPTQAYVSNIFIPTFIYIPHAS